MDAAEMLNLIEHYKWSVAPQTGGGWVIEMSDGNDDPSEIELARTRGTLREAIRLALHELFSSTRAGTL